jgi:hypothetical protein
MGADYRVPGLRGCICEARLPAWQVPLALIPDRNSAYNPLHSSERQPGPGRSKYSPERICQRGGASDRNIENWELQIFNW